MRGRWCRWISSSTFCQVRLLLEMICRTEHLHCLREGSSDSIQTAMARPEVPRDLFVVHSGANLKLQACPKRLFVVLRICTRELFKNNLLNCQTQKWRKDTVAYYQDTPKTARHVPGLYQCIGHHEIGDEQIL
jgi:hypothetical protein